MKWDKIGVFVDDDNNDYDDSDCLVGARVDALS